MHIYIHVPFCARRCSYCDFAITVRRETPDAAFVDAVGREWRDWNVRHDGGPREEIATLYFGGGTPSRLDPASIAMLIAMMRAERQFADDAEVTLETNPDDVTPGRAAAWHRAGINRISLGVQSHDPAVLEWMHRTHRAEQVPGAVATLRSAGMANISMDLIFALPTGLQRDWRADLDQTLALQPEHVSLYGLTIEPHTALYRWVERGAAIALPDERYAEEYLDAHWQLTAAGFEHYEVSNAGRSGFRSRHNSGYWGGRDYLGLGPSAHSFEGGERRWNVREWTEYHARSGAGESIVAGAERLDAEALALERLYLGLRTTVGLEAAEIPADTLATWLRERWATLTGGRVCLTVEGWLRLDALVAAARHS